MPSLLFHSVRIPALTSSLFLLPKVRLANTRLCNLSALMASSAVGINSPSSLVLCGKSPTENEIAKSIKSNNTLKLPDDGETSISLQSELDNKAFKEGSFGIDSFMNSLTTDKFGRFLIWSPRLSSTHDVVSHNFCELPIGTVCVADVQTKGRGRSKNVWESPLGCLLFSFTLQMEDGRVVPLVQYVVSLAITEAVKDICDSNGLPSVDVKIKWPNDLYLNGLKVGGILCTSTYKSKKFNVSAGIGLNVNNEKPTTCLDTGLRGLSVEAYQFQREDILAAFFNKFEKFYNLFVNEGFQTLEQLYYKTWLHSGQRVIVQEKKNEDKVIEHVVTIQGLTSTGYLLAVGDDNQMYELHPDGNSFDFFKGLVRRKLE
ncbi:biotin--protein ligase 2 [Senna tora]|uniref:Biotin--protein ligase 2 n=1 Tax=Senna tora TaxID=362788 RepID=A0A834T7V0_9FABA|nr:biotin--protein ligase 2 [Senna tora]